MKQKLIVSCEVFAVNFRITIKKVIQHKGKIHVFSELKRLDTLTCPAKISVEHSVEIINDDTSLPIKYYLCIEQTNLNKSELSFLKNKNPDMMVIASFEEWLSVNSKICLKEEPSSEVQKLGF